MALTKDSLYDVTLKLMKDVEKEKIGGYNKKMVVLKTLKDITEVSDLGKNEKESIYLLIDTILPSFIDFIINVAHNKGLEYFNNGCRCFK
jgi:hypothetical protein